MKRLILLALILWLNTSLRAQSGVAMVHLKLNQNIDQMEEIRSFYKEVMGLKVISPEGRVKRDYIEFDNGQRLNLIYLKAEQVASEESFMKGIWIRLEVKGFEEKRDRIKQSGVRVIKEVPGKELYFQAPGRQVFRMVKADQ